MSVAQNQQRRGCGVWSERNEARGRGPADWGGQWNDEWGGDGSWPDPSAVTQSGQQPWSGRGGGGQWGQQTKRDTQSWDEAWYADWKPGAAAAPAAAAAAAAAAAPTNKTHLVQETDPFFLGVYLSPFEVRYSQQVAAPTFADGSDLDAVRFQASLPTPEEMAFLTSPSTSDVFAPLATVVAQRGKLPTREELPAIVVLRPTKPERLMCTIVRCRAKARDDLGVPKVNDAALEQFGDLAWFSGNNRTLVVMQLEAARWLAKGYLAVCRFETPLSAPQSARTRAFIEQKLKTRTDGRSIVVGYHRGQGRDNVEKVIYEIDWRQWRSSFFKRSNNLGDLLSNFAGCTEQPDVALHAAELREEADSVHGGMKGMELKEALVAARDKVLEAWTAAREDAAGESRLYGNLRLDGPDGLVVAGPFRKETLKRWAQFSLVPSWATPPATINE